MKILSGILLLIFFSGKLFAQSQDSFFIHREKLPPEGISLNKGWKFHAGDDTAWANPGYDDSQWQTVDLTQYNNYFTSFREKGSGWFRQKFYLDSSHGSQASILLSQLGASDWYVNGRIFIQFGKINTATVVENYNPHDKPVLFPENINDSVMIAIRLLSKVPAHPWLFTNNAASPISIKMSPLMNALSNYKAALLQPRMHVGYSFMAAGVGIIFLLLFTFFPREKSTLLFAAFCFLIGLIPVIETQLSDGSFDINSYAWMSYAIAMINKICGILILLIISLEVLKKITIYQWAIIFYILVVDSLLFIYYGPAKPVFIAGNIVWAVFAFEFLRLGVLAFSRGDYTIGIVAFSSGFLNASLILTHFTTIHFAEFYTFFNGFLCFMLITIYLVSKFARNSNYALSQLAAINKKK